MMHVNGKNLSIPHGRRLADLLIEQGYAPEQVAVERNGVIVPKGTYAAVSLNDEDVLEILQFIGGGSETDPLMLGGHRFTSRFILGSGKYSVELIKAAIDYAGAQMITVALRRANQGGRTNILDYIPPGITVLPNTSGARTAEEAVRIAYLARELGCGKFVKVEVIRDTKYLLPDNYETIRATEILTKSGFAVMPYISPDLNTARDLVAAGAVCVMPLAAPIGSNRGLCARDFIKMLIDEIDLPVIVDAGIGRPSHACEAMEMGAAAVMVNTAIATAGDIPIMASAFRRAVEAGRAAYRAGMGRILESGASASSPLTSFLHTEPEGA